MGVNIDDGLSWSHHLTDVKTNFVNKLNLLKRSYFLSRNALLDLSFKIIVPSVLYGLVFWGGCPLNVDLLHSLEVIHHRAARIICKLLTICLLTKYTDIRTGTLTFYYKLRLIKLFHSVFIGEAPEVLSYLTASLCKILISSFVHKIDFAHNFPENEEMIVAVNAIYAIA